MSVPTSTCRQVEPSRGDLVLSVGRALWHEVSAALRAVFCTAEDGVISIRFVVEGPITDDDRDSTTCVAAEVVADFPDHQVDERIEQVDPPTRVTVPPGWHLVFHRRES
ncbi:hypothetical protein [Nocardia caishijiensis]|uniref:Uncharacterized protein n=1 Tax=Nocardia caishijiensis TaxID=184756 RepID=A0ABQ6YK46_9NOCA|nr:hypothetical protein [Nocardia caishijiensis]KAF0845869.1 hypothetical protein FNL39_106258 [Nocardia caishijiensis]